MASPMDMTPSRLIWSFQLSLTGWPFLSTDSFQPAWARLFSSLAVGDPERIQYLEGLLITAPMSVCVLLSGNCSKRSLPRCGSSKPTHGESCCRLFPTCLSKPGCFARNPGCLEPRLCFSKVAFCLAFLSFGGHRASGYLAVRGCQWQQLRSGYNRRPLRHAGPCKRRNPGTQRERRAEGACHSVRQRRPISTYGDSEARSTRLRNTGRARGLPRLSR